MTWDNCGFCTLFMKCKTSYFTTHYIYFFFFFWDILGGNKDKFIPSYLHLIVPFLGSLQILSSQMSSPLFCVNDVAAHARTKRETRKRKRRDTYEYWKHLSNNIKPFKKRCESRKKRRITQQLSSNNTYSQLTDHSSFAKTSTTNEVLLDVNLQQETNQHDFFELNSEFLQQEVIDQSDDEFDFDENGTTSPETDEELGIKILLIIYWDSSHSLLITDNVAKSLEISS